ncbi:MAG: DM13 domain-containing protein [Thermoactinospora sp.]|nr:DM13 domain-containing protein [Thermoactinospora sp.]
MKRLLLAGLVVVVSVGLYLFQPWRLFTTVEVDEALPTSAPATTSATTSATTKPAAKPAASTEVLATGAFRSHEHSTSGEARVLRLPDGSRVLRLENLRTSDGPDLRVWLSDQPVTGNWFNLDDGRWLELGELKGNKGNANYAIPASADLDRFTSVTIWCKRFKVSFGAASLVTA